MGLKRVLGYVILGLVTSTLAAQEQPVVINLDSIIRITYQRNLEIQAARFEKDAADLQFNLFEKRLSQFTPFVVEAGYQNRERRFERSPNRHIRQGGIAVGSRKEFFDGTEVELFVGSQMEVDISGSDSNPYIDFEISKPLFGSAERLERIIERNFEENEKLSASLDFIDTIRELIFDNQFLYIDIQHDLREIYFTELLINDLQQIVTRMGEGGSANDIFYLENQIEDYRSEILEEQNELESTIFRLLDELGLQPGEAEEIFREPIDFSRTLNGRYFDVSSEDLLNRSIAADVEIRILEIAERNAALKAELARAGKLDIVGKLFSRYDAESIGRGSQREAEFLFGAAIEISRIDPKLLMLTERQAGAEVMQFATLQERRKRRVSSRIESNLAQLNNRREIIEELQTVLYDKKKLFEIEVEEYFQGRETVENLLRSRNSILSTEYQISRNYTSYMTRVALLDEVSGLYYEEIRKFDDELGEF